MKKILLIGKTGCGKTTLTQRINGEEIKYKKTQMISVEEDVFDTPGEYLENKFMYTALIVSSYECDVIGLIQASNDPENMFPPSFSSAFTKPVIGIITKSDLNGNLQSAEEKLIDAGAEKVFVISSYEDKGIDELIQYLEEDSE